MAATRPASGSSPGTNRFDLDYEITSHCDYWDFIGALVDHRQCVSLAPLKEEVA